MRMMLPKRSPVHANACLAWIAATEGPHIATEDGQGGEGCRMETWLMGTEREQGELEGGRVEGIVWEWG